MQSNFRLWMRVGEERELSPKDFARRTAIKPVAPCRGDFCADIFSVSSFVPHRGSRLSLSFSLFRSRVLSLPVLLLPCSRCRKSSFSFHLFLIVRLSIRFRFSLSTVPHIATASFRGHEIAAASEESERGSQHPRALWLLAHAKISRSFDDTSRLLVRL